MAKTLIRGNTQIMADTITNAEIAAAAAIASTKLATYAADRNAGGFKLTNLAAPTAASDAATMAYVDGVAQGLDIKASVRVATTASITLSGTQTIDGIALSVGNRVLVKDQATGSQNGIYLVAAGAWTRTTDADTSAKVTAGLYTFVEEGTTNGDTGWVLTTDNPITLATTTLVFSQFTGAGTITAGAGLTKTGTTLDVVANADGSITVNADDIQVKRDGAGAIATSASGLAIAVGAATGLAIVSNALGIKLNGASLTLGASGLSVTNPASFATRETPSGAVNGSNVTFVLANTPTAGSESAFLNGILQEPGAGNDYTISGGTITYLTAPVTGDRLRVSYRY